MKNSTARKLKQVPKGYLVMGIDPHKRRHAVERRLETNWLPELNSNQQPSG